MGRGGGGEEEEEEEEEKRWMKEGERRRRRRRIKLEVEGRRVNAVRLSPICQKEV